MTARVSILLPTRKRPGGAITMITSLFGLADDPDTVEVLCGLDEDDAESASAIAAYYKDEPRVRVISSPRTNVSGTLNGLYEHATGDIVGWAVDDMIVETPGWDAITRAEIAAFGFWNPRMDGRDNHCGHPFMMREMIERLREAQGFIVADFFPYWFSDTWFDEIGQMIGAKTAMAWGYRHQPGDLRTTGMRDLAYWAGVFERTRPMRVRVAEALTGSSVPQEVVTMCALRVAHLRSPDFVEAWESRAEPEPNPRHAAAREKAEAMIASLPRNEEMQMKDAASIDAMIDAEKAKKVLAVCLPLYDGKVCWETWFQLREEEQLFRALGLGWRIDPIVVAGCSAIHIARNDAVHHALKRGADAIIWVDGDMNWSSGAMAQFIAHDVDIVAAAVPRKETPIAWNVRWLDEANIEPHPDKGLIEVSTVGTGFMFTKKRVYELLAERLGPEYRYKGREDGEERVCYFEAPISWGEDTRFCHLWRTLVGGKVWVDPAIMMQHVIAPKWSVTGKLADWLAEREGERAAAQAAA